MEGDHTNGSIWEAQVVQYTWCSHQRKEAWDHVWCHAPQFRTHPQSQGWLGHIENLLMSSFSLHPKDHYQHSRQIDWAIYTMIIQGTPGSRTVLAGPKSIPATTDFSIVEVVTNIKHTTHLVWTSACLMASKSSCWASGLISLPPAYVRCLVNVVHCICAPRVTHKEKFGTKKSHGSNMSPPFLLNTSVKLYQIFTSCSRWVQLRFCVYPKSISCNLSEWDENVWRIGWCMRGLYNTVLVFHSWISSPFFSFLTYSKHIVSVLSTLVWVWLWILQAWA